MKINKQQIKPTVISIFILMVLLIGMFIVEYKPYIVPLKDARERIVTTNIGNNTISLQDNSNIEFNITPHINRINGISLAFDTLGGTSKTKVHVTLKNATNNVIIEEWTRELSVLFDGTYSYFDLKKEQEVDRDDKFKITVEVLEGNRVTGGLYTQGNKIEKIPAYEILGDKYQIGKELYIGLAAVMFILIGILAFFMLTKNQLEIKFCVIAVVIGLVYNILIPPFVVPDEPAHFLKAYVNSSRLLGQEDVSEEGNIILRSKDYFYFLHESSPRRESYKNYINGILGNSNTMEDHTLMGPREIDAPVIGYIPQILGISTARIFQLNGEQLFMFGRLFALMFYIICVCWAIRIIPFAKEMIFVIGLLPMSMQEAVSFSYDSTVNGVSFLLISYFLYLIYEKDKINKKDIIIVVILTAIVSPIKIVYIVIIGLGILIPNQKFDSVKKKWIIALGLVGVGVGTIVLSRMASVNSIVNNSGNTLPWIDEPGYGVHNVIHYPLHTVGIFVRTLGKEGYRLFEMMIGTPMGWLEINIPRIVITGFVVLLWVSVLKKAEEKDIPAYSKLWMLFISSIGITLVCFSMLTAWTRESSLVIEGLQGRYFLPYLPMVLLICRNKCIIIKQEVTNWIVYGTVCLQMITMMSVFIFVIGK